jgi:hypothetical protein
MDIYMDGPMSLSLEVKRIKTKGVRINMKNLLIGLTIGAIGGWFFTRNYYENEIEEIYEEINSEQEELHIPVEKEIKKVRPVKVNVVENVKDLVPSKPKKEKRQKPQVVVNHPEYDNEIELITEEGYHEEFDEHDKVELIYDEQTNCIFDSEGAEESISDTIGKEILDWFITVSDEYCYVRNNKMQMDFMVEKKLIDENAYDELAAAYQEEKQKILDEKNRGVNDEKQES